MKVRHLLTGINSAKQRKIVETAFELFNKYGFKRVSLKEICSKADVSKVTLYRYFSGKDELILFIIRLLIDDFIFDMDTMLDSSIGIKSKFYEVTLLKQKLGAEIGEEMLQGIVTHPVANKYFTELRQNMMDKFQQLLQTEQDNGNINSHINIEKSIKFIYEINNLYSEKRLNNIYSSFEEMVDQINEILVMGLIARNK